MFGEIFSFEWRFRLRQGTFWLYCGVFFLLTFAAAATDAVRIGGALGKVARNSPFVIVNFLALMSSIGVIVTTALVATSINRDHELGTQPLFFSTTLGKLDYLGGRFAGNLLAAFAVQVAAALGILVASFMPWQDPERIVSTSAAPYAVGLLIFALPNLFFTRSLSFAIATLTRSAMAAYAGIVGFFVLYGVSAVYVQGLDRDYLASLADPFGLAAFARGTRYWTVFERNTLTPPLSGALLWNRLIWTGLGLSLLVLTQRRYRLELPEGGGFQWRFWRRWRRRAGSPDQVPMPVGSLPVVIKSFGPRSRLAQWFYQTRGELRGIVRSTPFIVIALFGILNVVGGAIGTVETAFGTKLYPVTQLMLRVIQGSFALFLLAVITFYAGELVFRERDAGLSDVTDALPLPNWISLTSKLAGLMLSVVVLMAVIMGVSIAIQSAYGYYTFELGLYLEGLFARQLPFWIEVSILSLTVQVFLDRKYLGFGVMILYFISVVALPALDLEHSLYRYAQTPPAPYSDMNGIGHFAAPLFWVNLYWLAGGLILLFLANLFWVRGTDNTLRVRLRLARRRLARGNVVGLAAACVAFVLLGAYIFYNTNILNPYLPSVEVERRSAEYEKRYKQYDGLPQPRVTAARVEVDIYPETRRVDAHGDIQLVNQTQEPISELHVLIDPGVVINSFSLPDELRSVEDTEVGYHIYVLESPLEPAEELEISFHFTRTNPGFVNNSSDTSVLRNGTFINNQRYVPHFGYARILELVNPNERTDHGLPERERMAAVDDLAARQNNYISHEADWVDFESIVSTSLEQMAIAPGYLQREWIENGRRYFHYKMDAPILNFFSFQSADYAVARDRWQDVDIEIYYHEPHDFNVERMIEATKKSLAYFSENFGPYQHRQVRILEFPRYRTFAQSFPNTIPYSEGVGFIADVRDPEDIDYIFYVTAHEVAHQWWAHQVIGGNVQGSTLLSESMSQYSALLVMEKEYGPDHMKKFLKYELNQYLSGRGGERIKEMPILLVENQPYIHYRKGSLVLYALRQYIGEERLNAALARYVKDMRFQQPPYTNSLELISYIREVTPSELQYIIDDWFETITLYDNEALEATATPTGDGHYRVNLLVGSRKLRADELGEEREVPLDDLIPIGIFGETEVDGETEETTLYLEMHRLRDTQTELEFVVDERPVRAGIDPSILLIDRNPDDNVIDIQG